MIKLFFAFKKRGKTISSVFEFDKYKKKTAETSESAGFTMFTIAQLFRALLFFDDFIRSFCERNNRWLSC